MARIPMTSGFTLIPEGTYVFRIYDVKYDEDFGKLEIKLVNATGMTHTERFSIKNKNDELNENALRAFSYFAKTAMNNFDLEDIDPEELIDHYIYAEVVHTTLPSNRDPNKTITFANLGNKSPADGFDTEPTARALSLGRNNGGENILTTPETVASAPKPTSVVQPKKGLDLDVLLGGN